MAETATAEPVPLPGDKFVSVPFNVVVLISWGLVSVRSRKLACFIAALALAVNLYITYQLTEVYAVATWRKIPAADVTQEDVTEFLILGLVRWISSLLYSASVCKLMVRFLPFADIFSKQLDVNELARIVYIALALFVAFRYTPGGAELETLRTITRDWSIYWYYYISQLGDCLRAVLQVYFLTRKWDVSMERSERSMNKIHVFVCSAAIFVQTGQNIHGYGLEVHSALDIVLQLFVMKRTWKHFRKGFGTAAKAALGLPYLIVTYTYGLNTRSLMNSALQYVKNALTTAVNNTLLLLQLIVTGLKTVSISAAAQFNTARQNYMLPQLQVWANAANQLKVVLTTILSLICSCIAIVVTQFGIAWRNYMLHWLEDDAVEQPAIREDTEEDRLQQPMVYPHHVLCQRLIEQMVANRIYYMVERPQQQHESQPQLMEHTNSDFPEQQPATAHNPVPDSITSEPCTFEIRPQEANNNTPGLLVPNV